MDPLRRILLTLLIVIVIIAESVPNLACQDIHNEVVSVSLIIIAVCISLIVMLFCIMYYSIIKRMIRIISGRVRERLTFRRPEERPVAIPIVPVPTVSGDRRNREQHE